MRLKWPPKIGLSLSHCLLFQSEEPKQTWATSWQTNKNECAPSEDSDQSGHLPSLIRVFAVCMYKAWVLSYPLSARQRLISLGGCPGWSESSLGAHNILLVLSWGCSHDKQRFGCEELNMGDQSEANMSLVTRKPAFGVFDQVRLKPACTDTKAS